MERPGKIQMRFGTQTNLTTQTDLTTQSILLASTNHDVPALRNLLRNSSANVQDPETHVTPLHAAIAALEPGEVQPSAEELEAASKTVQFLLDNRAAWNAVDGNDDTPGCLAHRLGLKEIYDLIVEAGVRAELTTPTSDGYLPSATAQHDNGSSSHRPTHTRSITLSTSRVPESFNSDSLSRESQLMQRSADSLLSRTDMRVLNIGHSKGDLDTHLRKHQNKPREHRIIDANPGVVFKMLTRNWAIDPGVYIHEGRWQEVIPRIIEQGMKFDAIYFHPRGEDYEALREFFSTYLAELLAPPSESNEGGVFGFYNAMGADRKVSYDVYQKVAEKNLPDANLDVKWDNIHFLEVPANRVRNAEKEPWKFNLYHLPTCRLRSQG